MSGRRVGTHRTTRPLRCERCRRLGLSPTIAIAPGLEKLWNNGRYRDHANVSCTNGHHWWSVHPEALQRRQGEPEYTTHGDREGTLG